MKKEINTNVIIVGTGVSGLFSALNLPSDLKISVITKSALENSDSFLAQGGICVLPEAKDYDHFFEDTLHAGHYENRKESVEIMIKSSQAIIKDLEKYHVEFEKKDGQYCYTKEAAHSRARILFHEDITGQEITSKLLAEVKKHANIRLYEYTTMTDLILKDETCVGIKAVDAEQNGFDILADYTILACGGIGGLYQHSTNFPHLTGDGIEVCKKHGIALEHLDYVQIHPTTLYSKKPGRRFLISESVRGEGALLYNKAHERFVDELLPRDVVTQKIKEQMAKDQSDFVWLSMKNISQATIEQHFPNIQKQCLEEGYDVTKEWIPVVPAQHYFMGGIHVDQNSETSMKKLYAVGETSCNGVHGANRLASNSLLESLVFAKRAARDIMRKQNFKMVENPKAEKTLFGQAYHQEGEKSHESYYANVASR